MNILVVAHYHYQGISVPTALFVHEQMKAFVRAGHRVRILVPTPVGKVGQDGRRFGPAVYRETVDGIEHVFLRHLSFSNYGQWGPNTWCALAALRLHLREILRDFTPDVIHAHKLGLNTELGAALREGVGCPLVFTSHGETGCEEPWISSPPAIKRCADKADRVLCVSSAIRRCMDDAGVAAPRDVILDGFALEHVPEVCEKRPLSVLQASHLTVQKRVSVTVEAFRRFRAGHPGAVLTLMGQGPKRQRLEQQCAAAGLADSVRFTGEVANPQVLAEMAKTQFFCMPSVHEGFGIVYLEAMASGCVTIGTEGEGIADLIVSGENGFLVPPEDPQAIVEVMEWCLQNPEAAAAIAERGRQDARSLTWDRNARQYIKLFEEVCS